MVSNPPDMPGCVAFLSRQARLSEIAINGHCRIDVRQIGVARSEVPHYRFYASTQSMSAS
jgi:hypothetical protein